MNPTYFLFTTVATKFNNALLPRINKSCVGETENGRGTQPKTAINCINHKFRKMKENAHVPSFIAKMTR